VQNLPVSEAIRCACPLSFKHARRSHWRATSQLLVRAHVIREEHLAKFIRSTALALVESKALNPAVAQGHGKTTGKQLEQLNADFHLSRFATHLQREDGVEVHECTSTATHSRLES
jgi:hypothetical protein